MTISRVFLAVAIVTAVVSYFAEGAEPPDSVDTRSSTILDVIVASPDNAFSGHATGKVHNIFFMGMGKETAKPPHPGERGFEEI